MAFWLLAVGPLWDAKNWWRAMPGDVVAVGCVAGSGRGRSRCNFAFAQTHGNAELVYIGIV